MEKIKYRVFLDKEIMGKAVKIGAKKTFAVQAQRRSSLNMAGA